MQVLDLFNTKFEQDLREGAVDRLEQRRIDDLNARMDDLLARARQAANPEHKAALKREFDKIKSERDSYFKVKELKEGSMKREMEANALRMTREQFVDYYGGDDWVGEFWDNENKPMDEAQLQQAPQRLPNKNVAMKDPNFAAGMAAQKAGGSPTDIMLAQPDIANNQKHLDGIAKAYGLPAGLSAEQIKAKHAAASEQKAIDDIARKNGMPTGLSREQFMQAWREKVQQQTELPAGYTWQNGKAVKGVAEAGIGHDIVNKSEKMARATPPTPAGKVASTVKHAARWLAGKGGPGKEGPTYEGAEDIEDRGEYDQEGDMVKDNLHTIRREAEELERILSDNENVPEWVQDKLAQVKGMITSASEYMQTQRERDHEEHTGDEGVTMAEWKKEGEWKEIPKSKTGKPVDPRGEVTHLSDVARRETLRKLAQKKNSEKVAEESKQDLAAALMLKKAHAAFPLAKDDAEALALWIADKEQRDVNRLERENEREEEMIARIADQLKSKEVDEGWSDRIVAQRTGQPRTPYSVYIKGKKWKDFENEDHAENVANKLRAKFKAEGKDPSVITIAPTDYDKGMDEAANPAQQAAIAIAKKKEQGVTEDTGSWIVYDPETKQIKKRFKTHTAGKSYAKTHGLGFASSEYYFDNVKSAVTAEGITDFQKRRQRERDIDAGKPVAKQRQSKQTDYQKRRAEQKRQDELGEEKTRLDPKCWKGKKIGNPKTKMKGGVRVNNCVPAESVEEEAKKGLYYYVNKRKKAGTSRDKDDPCAPSAQDWKNAAKTAKKESVEEEWSEKYKRSIDCSHPKGFSQKAHCAGRKKNEGMFSTLGEDNEARDAVESAIIRRILVAHKDLLQKFGPQKVMDAAAAIADDHSDVEEIGTSDVSAYVHEVERYLAMNY